MFLLDSEGGENVLDVQRDDSVFADDVESFGADCLVSSSTLFVSAPEYEVDVSGGGALFRIQRFGD